MISNIYGALIAVKDIDAAIKRFETFLNIPAHFPIDRTLSDTLARLTYSHDELHRVGFDDTANTAYLRLPGGARIILMSTSDPQSIIGRFLKRRGEGLLSVILRVDDLKEELHRLSLEQIFPVNPANWESSVGESNFIHPKNMFGVQFELFSPRKGRDDALAYY